MFIWLVFLCLELLLSAVAQNLVTTHTSDISPLGTGRIYSLTSLEVTCQSFGGLLKKFVLTRPSDSLTTLQYSYDCIQAPSSQYLMNSTSKQTPLNTCDTGGPVPAGSIYYLGLHNVNCQGGLLSYFQLNYVPPSVQYLYSCSNYGTLSCYTGITSEREYSQNDPNVITLEAFNDLECISGYALSSFVYSSYGTGCCNWRERGKYTFTCCRISALTMLPSIKPTALPSSPTVDPSYSPSSFPSVLSTVIPSKVPSYSPTTSPSVLSTVIPSVVPSYSPSSVFPSVLPTTISPSNHPSTTTPSANPTTYNPSNEPTSSSPTYSLAPSTASPTISPTTSSPSPFPTTSSPTTFPTTSSPTTFPTTASPSENPSMQPTQPTPRPTDIYVATSQPTISQPMTMIFNTLTVGGFIAIVCIFVLILTACTFTLCLKWLSQRGQKAYAIPQDEQRVAHSQDEEHVDHPQEEVHAAHPQAYVVLPKYEANAPPYDIKSCDL